MAIQGAVNASLSKVVGLLETTFIVHLIGTVLTGILLLFNLGKGSISSIGEAPWYSYTGGIISIFIIYLVAFSIPKVGMGNATTAIVAAQIATAIAIDYCGLFELSKLNFSGWQLAGALLLVAGVKLLLR